MLEVTPEHPLYLEGKGWLKAEAVTAGDRLRRIDGGWAAVLAIERVVLDAPVGVYNFTVAGVHTYFVLEVGVLVHNCAAPIQKGDEGLLYYAQLLRQARRGQTSLPRVGPIANRMPGASSIFDNIYDEHTGAGLYALIDPQRPPIIQYIGKGDVWDRRLYHRETPGREHLRQIIIAENNLLAREAAGLEQLFVEQLGGPVRYRRGPLLNKNWPIRIANSDFYPSIRAATPLFQEARTILDAKIQVGLWH
jgi:hypothetical protein